MIGQQVEDPPLEQAEFETNDVDSELARATIRQVLTDLNGVHDVRFLGREAVVSYNPVGVTKEEICKAIRQIGYRATEIVANDRINRIEVQSTNPNPENFVNPV